MNSDGSFRGSVTPYITSTEFKERLTTDLKRLLRNRIGVSNASSVPASTPAPIWTGSPYPGLRSFMTDEAAIFFGRGREVDALIARLRDPAQRFLAAVGASGTGKSSLIRAGLIPRLQDGAIEGSQDWHVVTCTPGALGDNPFLALAAALPAHAQKSPMEIATALVKTPQRFLEYAITLTGGGAVLLFVDQLEELLTHAAPPYRNPFGALLAHAVTQPHLRVVATLRADFLPQCAALPDLAPLLQAGTFVLAPPGPAALADMIRRPAERAGLILEDGLADEILKDAGTDPGALPLMAFCLEELYRQTAPDHRLTVDAYDALGRLRGAISRRAAALLEELRETEGADIDAVLPRVFQALVHVDAGGTATRRRAFQDELSDTAPIPTILDKLVKGRLLAAEDADGRPTITLAHEALLLEWPALRDWVDCNYVQMQRVQRLIAALGDADKRVRESAAEALGEIGLAAVPALITALGDAEVNVRASAAKALEWSGPAAAEAVLALITALDDVDMLVCVNAAAALGRAWALGQIGPTAEILSKAVSVLIAALGDANTVARQNATRTLMQIRNAAEALGWIGLAIVEVVPMLITALHDTDMLVRVSAADALGEIGPAAVEAVPTLIIALGDAYNRMLRESAAKALGRIGPAAAEAVPALVIALGDGDAWVCAAAAYALGQIGPVAIEAVPALITAFGHIYWEVRGCAAEALGRIGPVTVEVVPALITALGDAEVNVRGSAAKALGQIGPAAADAVPALTVALHDSDQEIIKAAKDALQQIQSASPATNSG